jgi:hypothetical protein
MRPDDVREHLDRRPFQPFRIHLSNGIFFDVRQPHLASVMRSTVHIGLPLEGNMQRFAVVALVHVVWIEVLLPAP